MLLHFVEMPDLPWTACVAHFGAEIYVRLISPLCTGNLPPFQTRYPFRAFVCHPHLISGRHAHSASDAKGRSDQRAQPPRMPGRGRQNLHMWFQGGFIATCPKVSGMN